MINIIVSACLLGENVRYNGRILHYQDTVLQKWLDEGRVFGFCPETAGGLSIPRSPSEIEDGSGIDVLNGQTRVMSIDGQDNTAYFINGAKKALNILESNRIGIAVLKNGSPSCGSTYIYNGEFTGTRIDGKGVLTAFLEKSGIRVFNEKTIQQADDWLEVVS